jgi:hypothetical protein
MGGGRWCRPITAKTVSLMTESLANIFIAVVLAVVVVLRAVIGGAD